jgi:hypothetical protein
VYKGIIRQVSLIGFMEAQFESHVPNLLRSPVEDRNRDRTRADSCRATLSNLDNVRKVDAGSGEQALRRSEMFECILVDTIWWRYVAHHLLVQQSYVQHFLIETFKKMFSLQVFPHHILPRFDLHAHQVFDIVVWWKPLCFNFRSSSLFVFGFIYEFMYPIEMRKSETTKTEAQQFSVKRQCNARWWPYLSKHVLWSDMEKLLKGITFEKFCRKTCCT